MRFEREVHVEKQIHTVDERVEKVCAACGAESGHVVASVTKRGQISRVDCAKCGARSTFKANPDGAARRSSSQTAAPSDRARTYRVGQTMQHDAFGFGEVMATMEPQKIDVLFPDRMRRLVHSHAQAAVDAARERTS